MALVGIVDLFYPTLLTPVCLLAAFLHGVRLQGFYPRGLWAKPLLWILFVGYAWMPIGFSLRAAAGSSLISPFLALHALTAGVIGVMTLGMMVRVSLGHTGRPLEPGRPIVVAFVLMQLAVLCRTIIPVFDPTRYLGWLEFSGGFWVLAFVICLVVLTPILLSPRPDGKPG